MLDLWKLQIYVTVCDAGSFNEAARRLCLDRSWVGRKIKELEETLGTTLIGRNGNCREMWLTASGVKLLNRSRQILKLVESAEAAVREAA